jgi:transposase
MIGLRGNLKIVVATQPVDFRRGINGLTALVAEALKADPYCGDVFIFRAKRTDRLKLLVWDGSGMILATKWLEESRFIWPPIRDGAMELTASQAELLLAGLDWTRVMEKRVRRPLGVA